MSLVKIQGNASGTGEFTIAAPNSNTNRTLTLPDNTGTILTAASTPAFASTIGVGGATAAASGAGITFPATASASSDVNTLDDYEEGTWTFGISFGGGTTGITYAASAGSYTKIGQMVTVRGYMELTNKGSSTGSALITGLPFTINNATANHTACALAMKSVTFADWPMAWASPNSTTVILNESTNAGVQTALTNADFANNSWVMISCSYYTS